MSRYLWDHWNRLRKRVHSHKRRLVLVDFDGTLVPIAKTPDAVSVAGEVRRDLLRLSKKPGWRLAVITGRGLKNLKTHLDLKELWYAGNHGLEMKGCGLILPSALKGVRKRRRMLSSLVRKLKIDLQYLPGFLIEDKGAAVSLHFRNLLKESSPAFVQALNFLKHHTKDYPLLWRRGKKVWEIGPSVRWHKGYAARYLLKRCPGAFPIAIGDDRADEDMFRAVKRSGLSVRVGSSQRTCADYYLRSQKEVALFLEVLCDEF